MSATSIRNCGCKQDYRDARYGKSKRVCNEGKPKQAGGEKWVCTGCGREVA